MRWEGADSQYDDIRLYRKQMLDRMSCDRLQPLSFSRSFRIDTHCALSAYEGGGSGHQLIEAKSRPSKSQCAVWAAQQNWS